MPQLIPTSPDTPNYTMGVTLDGSSYLLTFRLSERESCYFVDLALSDFTPLVSGKRVVCKIDLFGRYRYNALMPQGALVAFPSVGLSDEPPNLGELGKGRRVKLWYYSQSEIAGLPVST